MIIPIKCFTCGSVLANKYLYYCEQVRKHKTSDKESINKVQYLTEKNTDKTIEGTVLDDLSIKNPCCRRHMLTHVDIE
jgi:DNA-directed RNA polymerase subunit N (RpoN/RPB10)